MLILTYYDIGRYTIGIYEYDILERKLVIDTGKP